LSAIATLSAGQQKEEAKNKPAPTPSNVGDPLRKLGQFAPPSSSGSSASSIPEKKEKKTESENHPTPIESLPLTGSNLNPEPGENKKKPIDKEAFIELLEIISKPITVIQDGKEIRKDITIRIREEGKEEKTKIISSDFLKLKAKIAT